MPSARAQLPEITVVIPAYNSEKTLPLVVAEVRAVLHSTGRRCDFVLVDDSSSDQTWQVIQQLCMEGTDVCGIHLARNFGQHNALLAGIRAARGGTIVTVDDDQQHPAAAIPMLLAELERGWDVVYGYPRHLPHSLLRNLASTVTKALLAGAMGADSARHVSAFRAFRTRIRDAFADYRTAYVSVDVLLTWGAHRFTWIPVDQRPRTVGQSNYTLRTLLVHALTVITGFSTVPLRIASFFGLIFTAFGVLLLAYVLGRYVIDGGSVPGFPFLASAIAVFSGIQLFALGIMGEYLARVHTRMLGKPAYVIGATASGNPAEQAEGEPSADGSEGFSGSALTGGTT